MTDLVVGVDGGKAKTVALITRPDGTVVGWGRSGTSDQSVVPLGDALDAVEGAIDQALLAAGASRAALATACFGLAGADWPEDFHLLRGALAERGLGRDIVVLNDAQIALRASAVDGPGMVLSAGTHLCVAIRTTGGQEWFSGWSSVDGPGGAETGRRVLWAVLHAHDGRGAPTALTAAVLQATGESPASLLRAISRGEVDERYTAQLAPILFRTHDETGDAVAMELIEGIARDMARWVTGLSTRFGLLDAAFDVYLTGGLFRGSGDALQEALATTVHSQVAHARLLPGEREPVFGAVFAAMARAGIDLTPHVISRMTATAPPPTLFETADPSIPPTVAGLTRTTEEP